MFRKVLIANRGEIACRIARTLQQMGLRVVAVYSESDRAALHVACADEAYPLEGRSAAESYLRGDRLIEIALECSADAIHPGYGFLSENAAFAAACEKAGLTFIGPSPDVIRAMGDKLLAKRLMEQAGVPVVPSWSPGPDADSQTLRREAGRIGFPLLVKAAAGGGGRGMRLVRHEGELDAALEAAAREARAAFGDGRVFLEKYIDRPRHVEIQILGDGHGNVVHLFERECSIQRRYQKIVEETPCVALSAAQRQAMGEASVRAAREIGYCNAGTIEFLLDAEGDYFFLEVNTRLQVEHAVTEMVLQHDLVRAQVIVAADEKLPFSQDDLVPRGHAIECRVCAEDVSNGFLPAAGTIRAWAPPSGPDVRIDSGVEAGSEVTVHYDSLLAKLIVRGSDRDEAIARMRWALRNVVILGVRTNLELLQRIIDHPEFAAGRTHTGFLAEHALSRAPSRQPPPEALIAAAWAARNGRLHAASDRGAAAAESESPWAVADGWRAL